MNLERPTAALRRLFVVAWLLWLPACGGAAADAPAAGNDSYARRAAAQLEVEALPGTGGGPYAGRELDLPLVPPDFVLADTAGEPFDFARDATRPVTLLYFGYASCPDVCPAHMAAISKALSQMPAAQADQVQVLFVSVDTVNDTPETLGDYLDNFADPGSAKRAVEPSAVRNARRTGCAGQKLQAPTSSGSPARPTRSTPRCKRWACRRPRSPTPTSSHRSIRRTCWPTPPITGRA